MSDPDYTKLTGVLRAEFKSVQQNAPVVEAIPQGRSIYIRGLGVTDANDARPILGTSGMGPCVAVAIYNPATKAAALAHFDVHTETQSIERMMKAVGGDHSPVTVHVVGGMQNSPPSARLVDELFEQIAKYPQASLGVQEVLNPAGSLRTLMIDTRDGKVYDNYMGVDMDKGPERGAVMTRHAQEAWLIGPLRLEYQKGDVALPPPLNPQLNMPTGVKP